MSLLVKQVNVFAPNGTVSGGITPERLHKVKDRTLDSSTLYVSNLLPRTTSTDRAFQWLDQLAEMTQSKHGRLAVKTS